MLKLINHNSYTIPFIKVIQFIFLKTIPIQAYCQHLKSRKTSRPTTFSPSFSLRPKGLAQARRTLTQASSLRLGESSTFSTVALHAFSLRRDFLRLSETFARVPKKCSGSPRRPFVENNLGEPLLISPRRDKLAWASLSALATVFTCSRHIGIPQTTIPPYHTSITVGKTQTITNNIE